MKKNTISFILVFSVFFFFYFSIALFLYLKYGYIGKEAVFLVEKATIALRGTPPQLENIGLIYPPLPFILVLPFCFFPLAWGAQFVTCAAMAFLATLIIRESLTQDPPPVLVTVIVLTLMFHPLVLYHALLGNSGGILYVILTFFYVYNLLRYSFIGDTLYIVFAGIMIGLMAFVRYEVFFLLVFLLPLIPWIGMASKMRTAHSLFSLILMNFIPPIATSLAWMYLNWLFTGDFLNFLRSKYSYFQSIEYLNVLNQRVLDARGNFLLSPWLVFSIAGTVFPLYFVLLIGINNIPFVFFFLAHIFAIALAVFFGKSLLALNDFLVLIPLSVLALAFQTNVNKKWKVFVGSLLLVVSIPLSVDRFVSSPLPDEQIFGNLLIGNPPERTFKAEWELAQYIKKELKQKSIIMDDYKGFPIVVFSEDPLRFILPYQNVFIQAATNPSLYADVIVVADPRTNEGRNDQLNILHPQLYQFGQEGWRAIKEIYPWKVYTRVDVQRRPNRP